MDFAEVEEKAAKLRQDLAADRLTEEECKAQMRELMVEDEEGNWWMVGYETGEWYCHDGNDWVQADPPDHTVRRSPPAAPSVPTLSKPTPRTFAQTDIVPPRTTPSRDVRTVAWWLLGISVLFVPVFGIGTIGIVGAIGMLQRRSWGRKMGLVFSILVEVAGFVVAIGIVLVLYTSLAYSHEEPFYWMLSATVIVAIIAGTTLAYLLDRESIMRGFEEEPTHPPGMWPIAIPMALTLLGTVPAVGLLRNRRWARPAMMVFLCAFALTSIIGAIAAGSEMRTKGGGYIGINEWGFHIALVEAVVMVAWCAVAFFYLKSPRISAWFQDHSREAAHIQ
jgi:hypothetical protein